MISKVIWSLAACAAILGALLLLMGVSELREVDLATVRTRATHRVGPFRFAREYHDTWVTPYLTPATTSDWVFMHETRSGLMGFRACGSWDGVLAQVRAAETSHDVLEADETARAAVAALIAQEINADRPAWVIDSRLMAFFDALWTRDQAGEPFPTAEELRAMVADLPSEQDLRDAG